MANTAYQEAQRAFAEKIIEQLKQGTAPWVKPWDCSNLCSVVIPFNATTGKKYSGWNMVNLFGMEFEDGRFCTYKQASSKNWQVRKGSKGFQIWRPLIAEEEYEDKDGNKKKRDVIKCFKSYTVFNASQIDRIPAPAVPLAKHEWELCELGEKILKNSGAILEYGYRSASYSPSDDIIRLPNKERFKSTADFYSTALHELAHWTGASSRLAREFANAFGTENYAKEELVAEIASWLISLETGIPFDPSQHLSYIDSWLKNITDNQKELFKAISLAEKAKNFILAFAN